MPSLAASVVRKVVLPLVRAQLHHAMWCGSDSFTVSSIPHNPCDPLPQILRLRNMEKIFTNVSPTHKAAGVETIRLTLSHSREVAVEVHGAVPGSDLLQPKVDAEVAVNSSEHTSAMPDPTSTSNSDPTSNFSKSTRSLMGSDTSSANSRTTLFALHGGAFVMGSPALYRPLWRRLAALADCELLSPEYPLAPEHSLAEMLDTVEKCYRYVLQTRPANSIVVVGDSAGGYLLAAMLLRIHQAAPELKPRAAIFSSPVLSFEKEWSDAAMRIADPLLPFEDHALQALAGFALIGENCFHPASRHFDLRENVLQLCETEAVSPLASPLFAAAMPKHSLVSCGSLEGLLPQLKHFASIAGNCELRVRDGFWHSYPLFCDQIPEAREEVERWAAFIREGSSG